MINKIAGYVLSSIWKVLPIRFRLRILDEKIIQKLDYSTKDIFLLTTSSVSIQRLNSCKKEPKTIEWLKNFIKQDTIFYDIGANTGAYSLVAASLMNNHGRVVSFEPVPSTFIELCQNIEINNLKSSIIPINIALNEKVDYIEFSLNSFDAGVGMHLGLSENAMLSNTNSTVFNYLTRTNTLDNVIKEFALPSPNIIKIDVDGPEFQILKGAKDTLQNSDLLSIQIEIDELNQPVEEISKYLEKFNFILLEKHPHSDENIFDYVYIKK